MILFFSISSFIHWKNLQKDLSPLVIVANQELTVFILGLIFVFLKNNKIKHLIEMKHQIKSIFIMALIIFMALNFSFFGLKITNPLISSMISLSGPFITMFLGVLFFKEPITKLDLFSIFLISLGILRLSN
jgi:drug/metabolite transporter (DMT)-like permease